MYDNRKFFDIKHPKHKTATPRVVRVPLELPYIPINRPAAKEVKSNALKIPAFVTLVVFLLVMGIFGLNILRFKRQATNAAPVVYDKFKQGAAALLNFDLPKAKDSFQFVSDELKNLNNQSPIKTLPKILDNLFKLSSNAAALSGELENLKENGLSFVLNKKGVSLIESLKSIQGKMSEINNLSGELKSQAASLGYSVGEFSPVDDKLEEADKFLSAAIKWLETPKKQRLVVFFQNPSEIRPTGGFIGSYGHATLFQGNLLDLEVRDIYDPDGQLEAKVIPPKPLQGITDKWGARDANWFFDFPTSAAKVLSFLEASKIYQEQGIKFSGVVAVNVGVIKDILASIGPITLPEYDLVITSDNFLEEVQREVESGDDKKKGEPKKILKVLTPLVFEKLGSLSEAQKKDLVGKLTTRFSSKDIMVYFKDDIIENYLKQLGVTGEVLELPRGFMGEYLAVVNSNIAGGKSDAFISQKVKFFSRINDLGQIKNKVVIERSHSGQNEKDWWYRATNRNYLQVYVTPGAELKKMDGATKKVIKPLVDYKKESFSSDVDLKNLESPQGIIFGKTVFPAWLEVKAGTTGKLELEYSSKSRVNLAGGIYQFIFEKQSGVDNALELEIEAPEGYVWADNDSRVFSYSSFNVPSRLTLSLELKKQSPQ